MAIDNALVGTWKVEGEQRALFSDISATGIYLAYSPWVDYVVSQNGLQLTVQYPLETATFDRVGDPATSLLGTWARTHPDSTTETKTYYDNNSYAADWEGSYWGVFVSTSTALLTGEFRGHVSTDNGVYTHDYAGIQTPYNYSLSGPDRAVFTDPATNKQAFVFIRYQPSVVNNQ